MPTKRLAINPKIRERELIRNKIRTWKKARRRQITHVDESVCFSASGLTSRRKLFHYACQPSQNGLSTHHKQNPDCRFATKHDQIRVRILLFVLNDNIGRPSFLRTRQLGFRLRMHGRSGHRRNSASYRCPLAAIIETNNYRSVKQGYLGN